ncbi:hypothetical protein LJC27_03705 [Christensenellaceae bacterium OttesenSCG-928-M15]|nr:hypothetical protein [Christensenellaceae bacterium OttesenSCG-928-M15]
MRVAIFGNITQGNVDFASFLPQGVTAILFNRGEYAGELAEKYADAHNIAKLGYPPQTYGSLKNRQLAAYKTLVEEAEFVAILYTSYTESIRIARWNAMRREIPYVVEHVSVKKCIEAAAR